MDVDWQQHLRWVRVEDRWMNIVDIGSGPPMICIHGLSGCWQNWLENIPHFAREHHGNNALMGAQVENPRACTEPFPSQHGNLWQLRPIVVVPAF